MYKVVFVVALLALAHAKPSYHDDGIILKGPSGVITKDGPIGPTGPATGGNGKYEGDAKYEGEGAYEWEDDGSYPGDKEYEGPSYYAPPAPPAPAPIYYATPAPVYYFPAPAPAHYAPPAPVAPAKGVVVRGPETVPALITGPVGKILVDGLYSPPAPAPKKYY